MNWSIVLEIVGATSSVLVLIFFLWKHILEKKKNELSWYNDLALSLFETLKRDLQTTIINDMEKSTEPKVETRFPQENYAKLKSLLEKKIVSSIEPGVKEKLRELISGCEEDEHPPNPDHKSYYFDRELAIELYKKVEDELKKRGENPPIEVDKLEALVKEEIKSGKEGEKWI